MLEKADEIFHCIGFKLPESLRTFCKGKIRFVIFHAVILAIHPHFEIDQNREAVAFTTFATQHE